LGTEYGGIENRCVEGNVAWWEDAGLAVA